MFENSLLLKTGTKTQNDLAIKEVLKLVDEKNEPPKKATAVSTSPKSEENCDVVTYSTDILEKFVTSKVIPVITFIGIYKFSYTSVQRPELLPYLSFGAQLKALR